MATSSNVSAGKPLVGGAIYIAPIGSTLPTDATTDLDTAFVSLGYISDAGVTEGQNVDTSEIKAWGGDTVLNINNGRTFTCQFTMLEVKNESVQKLVYGDSNVSGALSTGLTVKGNNDALPGHAIVIEKILTDNTAMRTVYPAAYITDIADVTFADSDAIGYQVTATATPDSAGNSKYDYIKAASV